MRVELGKIAASILSIESRLERRFFTGHPIDFYVLGQDGHRLACRVSGRTDGMGGDEVLPAFCEQKAAQFLRSLPNKYWVAKLLTDVLHRIDNEKVNEKISWTELHKAIEMNRAAAIGRLDNTDFERCSVAEVGDALIIGAFVLKVDERSHRTETLRNPVFFANLD